MKKRGKNSAGCILVTAFAAVCLLLGHEALAQEGLTKIAENVYSYVDVKGADPKNSFGANAGIVIGRDGIVVIDTLISAKEAQRFIKDIRAVSDKPIKYVVNTHYHFDHAWGNSEFVKLGATVIAHDNDKINALARSETLLKGSRAYGLVPEDMEGTVITYPTLTFSNRMRIDLGDEKVELIYPKASHTDGSILVYVPGRKALFTGDILFTGYYPFIGEGDIKSWTRVLDHVLTMDADAIIPGHGPLSSRKDVRDMKRFIVAFDKKAKQLCAGSRDIAYIVSEMKKALPPRDELDFVVEANIRTRYLEKR